MDIIEGIRTRRSIRGFKPDPVPKQIIKEILETAVFSPSGDNIQPWEFVVLTGEVLDKVRQDNVEKIISGAKATLKANRKAYSEVYRQRQIELAVQIFKCLNIPRDDAEKRLDWLKKGARFFDAPAAILITIEKSMIDIALINVGIICQSICLSALAYGLGTCIQGQVVEFPEVLRKHTGIPETKVIPIAISIGYPDLNSPANHFDRKREAVENITTWL